MTAPIRDDTPDFESLWGVNSEYGRSEWNTMMQRRQQLVDSILGSIQMQSQGVPKHVADDLQQRALPRVEELVQSKDYVDSVRGAAWAHGISREEADKLPIQQLAALVEQKRMQWSKDGGTIADKGLLDEASAGAVGALTGLVKGGIAGLRRYPMIDQALDKFAWTHKLNTMLGQVNEGMSSIQETMRMGMDPAMAAGFAGAANIGDIGGHLAASVPAWKLAGAVMRAAGITSSLSALSRGSAGLNYIGRVAAGAAQAATTEGIFVLGEDGPMEEKLRRVGAAAALGVAAESLLGLPGYLKSLDNKLASSFPTTSPRLGSGQRLLGPGPVEGGPAGPPPPMADFAAAPRTSGPPEGGYSSETVEAHRRVVGSIPEGAWKDRAIERFEMMTGQPYDQTRLAASANPNFPLLRPGESPTIEAGPIGSTGRLPESRQVGGPLAPLTEIPSPVLFDHYNRMADQQTNPEIAASLRAVAYRFGQPAEPMRIVSDFDSPPPTRPFPGSADAPWADYERRMVSDSRYDLMNAPQATGDAISLTKRATIAESPLVASQSAQASFDDADVIHAAMASNPGGIQIIRGVGDEAGTVAQLVRAQASGRMMPHEFRVVEHMEPVPVEYHTGPSAETLQKFTAEMEARIASEPQNAEALKRHLANVHSLAAEQQAGISPIGLHATLRQVRSEMGAPLDPTEMRVARRDILVSDGLPITNKRVAQYKETGMFEGQRATLPGGGEVQVVHPAPSGGFATVKLRNGDLEMLVPADDLLPGKTADVMPKDLGVSDAPELYNKLRNSVIAENTADAEQAGIPQFTWLDDQASSLLPQQVEKFLDAEGITNPVARSAMQNYFSVMRLKDFQATSPRELEAMRSINAQASARLAETRMAANLPASIDTLAGARGMRWESYPGTEGGTLRNIWTQEDFPMAHEDAAREFLKHYNFEPPELNPVETIPPEVAEMVTGEPVSEASTTEGHVEALTQEAEALEEELNGASSELTPEQVRWQDVSRQYYEEMEQTRYPSEPPKPPTVPPPPGRPPVEPPPPPPKKPSMADQFKKADPNALANVLKRLDDLWFRKGMTMRGVMQELQVGLENAGISMNKLWEDYTDIVTGKAQAHNASYGYHREINEVVNTLSSRFKRRLMSQVLELPTPEARAKAFERLGASDTEIAAAGKIRDIYDRLFKESGLPAERYIPDYVSHVRKFAQQGVEDPWAAAKGFLPKELQFFAEYARHGGLDVRELDIGTLMHTYTRALFTERFVGEPWARMVEKWNAPGIPDELRREMLDWLKVVRIGHEPGKSWSINGVRSVLNTMQIPVTNKDVQALWNIGLGGLYRNVLSRPTAFFRDTLQPLMAGTRIGMQHVAGAYMDFVRSPQARQEMAERAFQHGWAEHGRIPTGADLFSNEAAAASDLHGFSPSQLKLREGLSGAGDFIRDATPARFRGGIGGTKADPALLYGRLGEFNRIIAGEAGWRRAMAAFEKGGTAEEMLQGAGANVWSRPIRDRVAQYVKAGRFEDAAATLAHESANTQFRYGAAEGAMDMRSHDGRLFMTLQNFTTQQAQYIREGLSNGSVAERVGFATWYAAINGAILLASAKTGWDFRKWMWSNVSGPASPVTDMLITAQDILRGRRKPDPAGAVGSLAATVFPYTSIIKTASQGADDLRGAGGGEEFFRHLITGARGHDMQDWLNNLGSPPGPGQGGQQ